MEQEIEDVARALKRPAGGSELFATQAAILSNRAEFVRACHETWKKWHNTALARIQFHEGFLLREKTHPIGPSVKSFGEYNLAVWRRVNDAIVWSLFGAQRHMVKRLCLYKRRNLLAESNPKTALAMLKQLNADPMAIAIWNDATSCVDIGDILHIKNGLNPIPEFLELKEGPVNSAIIELLETNEESRAEAAKAFEDRFGSKGAKQLDRVLRQKKTGEQAISLLLNDKGVDPVTGYEMEVVETATRPENYDDQLRDLLEKADNTEEGILDCVDGCLWLFAASGGRSKSLLAVKRFTELLEHRVADFLLLPGRKNAAWDRDRIVSLSAGVRHQMAKPIYLRNIDARQIASLTYGKFHDNVLMYLDWNAFGKLFVKAGAKFTWGSKKDAGRARAMHPHMRPPLIRGRLPQVHVEGLVANVTDPNLIEMLYDGRTPWNTAQNLVEHSKLFIRQHSGKPHRK